MSASQKNFMVGLTMLLAMLVLAWMVFKFSKASAGLFAQPQKVIHFTGSRADGLSEGSAVLYMGIDVGHVTGVNFDTHGTVTIDAEVSRDRPLPSNIHGNIVQSSALGAGTVIQMVVDGNEPQGSLDQGAVLKAAYVGYSFLPPELSATAVKIGQMSDEIRLVAKQIHESNAIADLDKTIRSIDEKAQKLGAVLDSLHTIVGDPENRKNLNEALANIRLTSAATTRIAANVDYTITDVRQQLDKITGQIDDRLTQISAILTNLQSVAAKIDQGKGTAGKLVNDPELYQSLANSSRELDATIKSLHRLADQWEQEGIHLK